MKKLPLLFFTFLITILLCFLGFNFVKTQDNIKIASPLPGFLTSFSNKQVSTLNIWTPVFDVIDTYITYKNKVYKKPDQTAISVLMYDLTTDKLIFEKNSDKKLPIASLTKIMTAVVALENPNKNDRYYVHGSDLVGEDSMGLSAGEVLSLNELLYGLILHSGNDAAEVLASNFPGGRSAFIKAMNDKAKTLGLKNTNFTNPSGLEGDGTQYSTARDMLVITHYAISNLPTFSQIAATVSYHIQKSSTHGEFFMENETNLLTTYPGVKGVKTGYTPEAGYCLITYLDYGDHKIVGVLLGSSNRRQEMKDLLDYSLKTLGVEPPEHN